MAIRAIDEMAPAFLEDLILKLAETPNRANPDRAPAEYSQVQAETCGMGGTVE